MNLQQESILCVDDDPGVLDLLREYFTMQGFVVFTATNGVEAFLQVKQWMPRVVVMDLFMPRLGGIGALSRIKTLNPGIAVILMSGMINALELVTEAGLSVDGVIFKPLELNKLSDMLERIGLPGHSARFQPASPHPGPRARGGRRARNAEDGGRAPRGDGL